MSTKTKVVAARLDYALNWAPFLDGDTLATVAWSVSDPSLTIGTGGFAPTNTTTVATVWLIAGTAGAQYTVTCAITTAGGRINTASFTLLVQ